jgi:NADPH-dependent curcumin reductase CurA
MKNNRNRQVILKSRPADIPQADNFEIIESDVPDLLDGQILVHNSYLSVEPAMRGWVSSVANYSEPVRIGEVMRSFSAGEVLQSTHPDFKPGDKVMGMFGWQEFAVVAPAAVTRKVREEDLPLSLSLGVTGLNGITAYFGLLDVGQPRPGDTVVVSTAAGAVGSAVGQIAKLSGCRTVGIAGGPAKVAQCRELFGYDMAIDYKSDNLESALATARPRGVSLYFDNTGGAISDIVLRHLGRRRSRGDLRNRLGLKLESLAQRSARRASFAGQARTHAGVRHLRLRAPVRRGRGPPGAMDSRWAVALLRRHIERHRTRAWRNRRALSRREYRQAARQDSLTITRATADGLRILPVEREWSASVERHVLAL